MKYLDHIDSPQDLRKLHRDLLAPVADEVRSFLMEIVSEKGGHLASNLGTVELTLALHYVFDTPEDRLIWDVGHQSYPHKILTGRKGRFSSIRQKNGLSGFTSRNESAYDPFGAGHASTSISAALGIAEAFRHQGLPHLSIAVIGDGALTGGLAFEALNNAGHVGAKNLVVVLNDNDMSIDPNVGALRKFINHTLKHPAYNRLRRDIKTLLELASTPGMPFLDLAAKARKSVKSLFTPGILFECFGFRYYGPVNGHDVSELVDAFAYIKKESGTTGPHLVHVITTKGKGYALAEKLPLKYHGVTPFKVEVGITPPEVKNTNYQDIFTETLIELARKDPRIVAVTAAMPSGTGLNQFQKIFPERCYDVGIAEGHAVLFAAGLATEGLRPVVAIYSTFLQRAYDQVIHDVGLQNLNVIFAMDRAGLVGADGATHQGAFDLTYLRAVPNFVIMAPKDENELRHMLKTAIEYGKGPIAIRYPRGEVVGVSLDKELKRLPIGSGELVSSDVNGRGSVDVVLLAIGFAVQSALVAAYKLRNQGYSCVVLNARFIKPLDETLIEKWSARTRLIVTIEENTSYGGFGSAVLECLSRLKVQTPTMVMGMPDAFVEHASPKEQRSECGLDGEHIAANIMQWFSINLKKKSPRKTRLSSLTTETTSQSSEMFQ